MNVRWAAIIGTASITALFCAYTITNRPAAAINVEPQQFWVFLVTGKSAAGVAKDEIQMKQQAHLDNFKRLAEAKLLQAAGPMADPAKKLRGIVVVTADEERKLSDHFQPDPFVTEGFMTLEPNRIVERIGELTLDLSSTELDELRIVVWNRKDGAKKSDDAAAAHHAYWTKHHASGQLGFLAQFAADAHRFGIAVLPKESDEKLKSLLNGDPLVRDGFLTYQVMPQFLSKGCVKFKS